MAANGVPPDRPADREAVVARHRCGLLEPPFHRGVVGSPSQHYTARLFASPASHEPRHRLTVTAFLETLDLPDIRPHPSRPQLFDGAEHQARPQLPVVAAPVPIHGSQLTSFRG